MDEGVGDRLQMDMTLEWSTANGVDMVGIPWDGPPTISSSWTCPSCALSTTSRGRASPTLGTGWVSPPQAPTRSTQTPHTRSPSTTPSQDGHLRRDLHRSCAGRSELFQVDNLKYHGPVVITGWSRRNAASALRKPGSKRIYTPSDLAGLPNLRHTAMVGREAHAA
jgi:hypothetical protein